MIQEKRDQKLGKKLREAAQERWLRWIPDARECELGFGLYDESGRVFVATREAASTCRACLPGTHSKLLGGHVATCGVSDFWVPINKREPKGNDQRTDTGTLSTTQYWTAPIKSPPNQISLIDAN